MPTSEGSVGGMEVLRELQESSLQQRECLH